MAGVIVVRPMPSGEVRSLAWQDPRKVRQRAIPCARVELVVSPHTILALWSIEEVNEVIPRGIVVEICPRLVVFGEGLVDGFLRERFPFLTVIGCSRLSAACARRGLREQVVRRAGSRKRGEIPVEDCELPRERRLDRHLLRRHLPHDLPVAAARLQKTTARGTCGVGPRDSVPDARPEECVVPIAEGKARPLSADVVGFPPSDRLKALRSVVHVVIITLIALQAVDAL
mmetsp:Transcript_8908/g.23123  ORF Transcript_8908/g.23123 Transcript_8908/m.23123 type:complete len:229 (-) Transcript_8908:208-894(-)